MLTRRVTIPLGRLFGIPIGLDLSWFLIFALITWSLAASYFPNEFGDWPAAQYWIVAAVTAVLFFGAVLLHELGHSVVAQRFKVPVRRITLLIFGGVAELAGELPSAKAEFWIAIAGPAVSFALAAIFFVLQGLFRPIAPVFAVVEYLAFINGTLALFNLIPGFPLDGGRVLRAIVWSVNHNLVKATRIAATVGRIIAFGFIGYGVLQMVRGNFANGLWIAFIGWFLENAASSELQMQELQGLLSGYRVERAMHRDLHTVPHDMSLQRLVDEHVLALGQRSFAVSRAGEIIGLLTLHSIRGVPRDEWPLKTVGEAMTPLEGCRRAAPETSLWEALREMDRDGVNQLPVMSGGRMVGMLSRDDVISFMRTVQELGV